VEACTRCPAKHRATTTGRGVAAQHRPRSCRAGLERLPAHARHAHIGCSPASASVRASTSTLAWSCRWPRQKATSWRNRAEESFRAARASMRGGGHTARGLHGGSGVIGLPPVAAVVAQHATWSACVLARVHASVHACMRPSCGCCSVGRDTLASHQHKQHPPCSSASLASSPSTLRRENMTRYFSGRLVEGSTSFLCRRDTRSGQLGVSTEPPILLRRTKREEKKATPNRAHHFCTFVSDPKRTRRMKLSSGASCNQRTAQPPHCTTSRQQPLGNRRDITAQEASRPQLSHGHASHARASLAGDAAVQAIHRLLGAPRRAGGGHPLEGRTTGTLSMYSVCHSARYVT